MPSRAIPMMRSNCCVLSMRARRAKSAGRIRTRTAMFFQFFDELRSAKVPVTLKEYLALMEGLSKGVIDLKVDDFYYLSRTALVKDERNLDRFDRVFAHVFKGLETLEPMEIAQIPEEWPRALTEKFLSGD